MGLFDAFRKPPSGMPANAPWAEDMFHQLAPEVFPMGYGQVLSEGAELAKLLGSQLPEKEITNIYARSKTLIFIARDRTSARCVPSIIRKSDGRLTAKQAETVFDFACGSLGFNFSKSLMNYRLMVEGLFKTKIIIDRNMEQGRIRGSFISNSREVSLPEQNSIPYLVTYGSVLSAVLSAEYLELRQRLEDAVLNMMVTDGLSESPYADGDFSFSMQLVHDAVGNRLLDPLVWQGVFHHLPTMYPVSAKSTIEKLGESILQAIQILAQRNKLQLFSADNFIQDPKFLGKEVAQVLAIYAHEVKARQP